MPPKYEFIDKCLFFPEQGILVVGDLHIGYEQSMVEAGILLPESQVKETIEQLKKAIDSIEDSGEKLKKVVLLGDIKHMFSYDAKEKANFYKVIDFLSQFVPEKNIIIIKGNHDTMSLGYPTKDVYVDSGIAFVHGHQLEPELQAKNVHLIVSGHLHPSITLAENPGVKSESYKCFLTGTTMKKDFIVVPSFLGFYEGTPVNEYEDNYVESFSIIPKKDMMRAEIHVVGEDGIYDFGTIRDLQF